MPTTPDTYMRHITVRLSSATRAQLNDIAETSDRTLSQLIRYAILSYSPSPTHSPTASEHCHLQPTDDAKPLGVRLPANVLAKVEEIAQEYAVTPSSIIRVSLDSWLKTANADTLGQPVDSNVLLRRGRGENG